MEVWTFNILQLQPFASSAASLNSNSAASRSTHNAALRLAGSICTTCRIACAPEHSQHSASAPKLHRLLLQPPDPRQLHCFCWSLCLRGQNSESTQRSLSCPRHSASPRASLPHRHANRQGRATARWGQEAKQSIPAIKLCFQSQVCYCVQ